MLTIIMAQKLVLFPARSKKGNPIFIGKLGANTYICSDEKLTTGDAVIVEPSDSPELFFLKRAASGITVEIP